MYDHAIFATYSLSFMSLLVVVLALLGAAGMSSALLGWAAFLLPHCTSTNSSRAATACRGSRRCGGRCGCWCSAFVTSSFFVLLLIYLGTVD